MISDVFYFPMGNEKLLINFKQESEMITFVFLNNAGYREEHFLDGWDDGFIPWMGALEEKDL